MGSKTGKTLCRFVDTYTWHKIYIQLQQKYRSPLYPVLQLQKNEYIGPTSNNTLKETCKNTPTHRELYFLDKINVRIELLKSINEINYLNNKCYEKIHNLQSSIIFYINRKGF